MFKIYKLKWYEYLVEIILLILILIFTVAQKYFIQTVPMRFLALSAVSLILTFLFFIMVKPGNPNQLAKLLTVFQGVITVLIIIILHVIIVNDFSYKNVLVFLIITVSPYISGCMYKLSKKIN